MSFGTRAETGRRGVTFLWGWFEAKLRWEDGSRMTLDELVERARQAKDRAYAPYSHYRVGAALLTDSGRVHTGCNIENASYGATICAERVAAVKAISEGDRGFAALAVAVDGPEIPSPCGICRQFLAEFDRNLEIILAGERETKRVTLAGLLPAAFDRSFLPPATEAPQENA